MVLNILIVIILVKKDFSSAKRTTSPSACTTLIHCFFLGGGGVGHKHCGDREVGTTVGIYIFIDPYSFAYCLFSFLADRRPRSDWDLSRALSILKMYLVKSSRACSDIAVK